MKIIFFSSKPYDEIWFKPLCEQYGYDAEFFDIPLNNGTAYMAHGADMVCAFVNDDLSAPTIRALKELSIKGILLRCAGFNNVDIEAAKTCNIPVLRVPGYSPEAVAEFAMGLFLCVNRGIHRAYTRTRDFNMNINGLMGRDLCKMTAGIVGTGKIGQAMIKICKGFGMKVIAYDPFPNRALDIEYVDLYDLFKRANFISLHCPLTASSKYVLNKDAFNAMRNGVYIVNTSRGQLINTADLLEALVVPGKIGGVALDVYEEESGLYYEDRSNDIVEDERLARLLTFPNVLITSHQGYFTREAMQEIALTTLENAKSIEERNQNTQTN